MLSRQRRSFFAQQPRVACLDPCFLALIHALHHIFSDQKPLFERLCRRVILRRHYLGSRLPLYCVLPYMLRSSCSHSALEQRRRASLALPCLCRRLCVHSSVQAMLLQRIGLGRFVCEHFVQLGNLPLKRRAFRLSLPLLLLHYLLLPLARHPIHMCLLALPHGRFLLRLCVSLCVRLCVYLLLLTKRGSCHSSASSRASLFRCRFALCRGLAESSFFRANLLLARVALCHYLARRSRILFGCFLGCCALVHGLFFFNLLLRCLDQCLSRLCTR
mmetsp:Transcript_70387/g.103132  ORF Transcript_70387/g.103132 Transcript_70387/m.103132 type:complete len:274 (-) Transcript_70387:985-1806(-)